MVYAEYKININCFYNLNLINMKHIKILITSILFLGIIVSASAQYCPSPIGVSGNTIRLGSSSFYNTSYASNSFGIYRSNFYNTLNRGYRSGRLNLNEVRSLELDFDRLAREINWAYSDRRLSFAERSRIDLYKDRLERKLYREWNDAV